MFPELPRTLAPVQRAWILEGPSCGLLTCWHRPGLALVGNSQCWTEANELELRVSPPQGEDWGSHKRGETPEKEMGIGCPFPGAGNTLNPHSFHLPLQERERSRERTWICDPLVVCEIQWVDATE